MDEQEPIYGFSFDLDALLPRIEGKHHLAISYDPKIGFAMYLDGKEVKIDYMQHFRVWNRRLTAEEIAVLYEREYGG